MFVKCLKINVVSHLECIPGILCSHRNSGYSLMASYIHLFSLSGTRLFCVGEGDGRGSRSLRPREGCPTITTQPSNLTKWSPAVPLGRLAIRLSLGGS